MVVVPVCRLQTVSCRLLKLFLPRFLLCPLGRDGFCLAGGVTPRPLRRAGGSSWGRQVLGKDEMLGRSFALPRAPRAKSLSEFRTTADLPDPENAASFLFFHIPIKRKKVFLVLPWLPVSSDLDLGNP